MQPNTPQAKEEVKPRKDGLIFDIGMDACQDTDFYLKKGFAVVAVDANPTVCDIARERYAQAISAGQLIVLNVAISNTRKPLIFYVCDSNSAWSTADPKLRDWWAEQQGAAFREIEVPGVTPASLLETYGVPYFAKIDIEGYDLLCVKGLWPAPLAPAYISTEAEFRNREYRQQIAALRDLGYTRFALVSQKTAWERKPPRPALEGADVDHDFVQYASGLFGRELPDPWVSAGEILARCAAISLARKSAGPVRKLGAGDLVYKIFPKAAEWYDIHAAL